MLILPKDSGVLTPMWLSSSLPFHWTQKHEARVEGG